MGRIEPACEPRPGTIVVFIDGGTQTIFIGLPADLILDRG